MSFKPFDLTGKTALITGGNGGIGLGFAEGLAAAGADVCIWGTNEEKNANAKKTLEAYGNKVVALRCDVGDPDDVRAKFAETVQALGRVDSCFANAGIGSRGTPFAEMTMDEWRDIFRVNMEGVFTTLQESVRHMVKEGHGGSLIATSSVSAVDGAPRAQHYAATKGGLNAMMRGLAVEHARHGIRANAILPGWIETAMTKRAFGAEAFTKKVLPRVPVRRWGQPEDFSGIAVYLASDASTYHTGDVFTIDGGYTVF